MELKIAPPEAFVPEAVRGTPTVSPEFSQVLQQHREWLESNGDRGKQADLSGARLEKVDLTDVNLCDALLNKTVLKGAELLLADLRGANLLQANLQNADLLATKLQEANLQAANLSGAAGLQSSQLAGANLYSAVLPTTVVPSESLKNVMGKARTASRLTLAMLSLSALALVKIFTTTDVQLLKNSPVLPLSVTSFLPLVPFYLIGPVVFLSLYVGLHVYLQRFWEAVAALPAIFPDGRCLDTCLPWFARWPARKHFKWLRAKKRPLRALETGISMLLVYWIVPATLLLFWGRYLTLEDLRGTMLHVLLVVGAARAAMDFPRSVSRTFEAELVRSAYSSHASVKATVSRQTGGLLGLGVVLSLLALGTIYGIPRENSATPQQSISDIRMWAADVLWLFGYSPTAQLSESDVSRKPVRWGDSKQDLALVQGARLNRLRLRNLQGYRAFLARAHLWQADLRNALLSEADLREANLRQADLRYAILERARLGGAILQKADLRGANLIRADLRETDLSYSSLAGAFLLDTELDGANLYGSDLHDAQLKRASLQKADLREANLQGADLTLANLREAYLSSAKMAGARLRNAQLIQSFVSDTDLRRADLTDATLQGAIANGADLTGANLQGADLRGAVGLNASQVCSAANIGQIQLDEGLQQEVGNLCGKNRL